MKNYFRTFTALLPKKLNGLSTNRQLAHYLRNFLFVFLVLLMGVLLQVLVLLHARYQEAREVFAVQYKEYDYWSNVAQQFPMIPDVMYNAAVSSLKVGKNEAAVTFLESALDNDPLFERARELKEGIQEK